MICKRHSSKLQTLLKPLCILFIIAGVFGTVCFRSGVKSLEYRLGVLQLKEQQLIKEQRNLLVQREDLLSLKRIEHVAVKNMGFVFPDRNKVFYVKERMYPLPIKANY